MWYSFLENNFDGCCRIAMEWHLNNLPIWGSIEMPRYDRKPVTNRLNTGSSALKRTSCLSR